MLRPRLPLTNREKDVVRALACVMWADGHASAGERALIEHVIDSLDPTPAERREMMHWLAVDCSTLADVDLESLSVEEREVLFTDAALLAHVDDVVLPSERAALQKLAQRLRLSQEVVVRVLDRARDDEAISLPSRALEERTSAPPALDDG